MSLHVEPWIKSTLESASLEEWQPDQKAELLELLDERERVLEETKLFRLFPDTGPLRRELYQKHLEFFRFGQAHQERAFMAANRVGKTWGAGGYEVALHLTGQYPAWWMGRRFDYPVDVWAAGDTSQTTRDIIQHALLGVGNVDAAGRLGTGLIPAQAIIGQPTAARGITGAIDSAAIKHLSGGASTLGFKSYDQRRAKFQGTAKHVVWLDEEPPRDVYSECMIRLMTTDGLMILTFTPLLGLSDVALMFMDAAENEQGHSSSDVG